METLKEKVQSTVTPSFVKTIQKASTAWQTPQAPKTEPVEPRGAQGYENMMSRTPSYKNVDNSGLTMEKLP